ncbi:MAG: zinc metallopeptidase [Clostridia bacterium]|nr:zinc metallopeptidase [Clostridia bacterium]
MPFYYYFDPTMLIVLPALLLALYAQFKVKSAYHAGDRVSTGYGMTGYDAARRILDQNGLYHVSIEEIPGELSDHYDPRANVIRLSAKVYHSNTASAVGVAAHEAGHAVQYAQNYAPIRLRAAIIPVCNVGSTLALPLFLVGLLLVIEPLMWFGILAYSLTALFQLITLPVEFNASRRAMTILSDSGRFTEEQLRASRKVLSAAALTYVAALATSLLSVLRLIVIVGGRRRD